MSTSKQTPQINRDQYTRLVRWLCERRGMDRRQAARWIASNNPRFPKVQS